MLSTHNLLRMLALSIVGLFLVAPSLRAQEGGSQGGGQSADTPAGNGGQAQSAPGPIGGVEQYQLGGTSLGHSFVIPRFSLQEVYDSNAGYASTTSGSQGDAVTTMSAGFSLQWQKRNSTLSLDYTAAGLIYGLQTQSNSVVQQLGVSEKFTLRRWNIFLGENFSYLPNSQFGLGGLLGATTPGFPGTGGTTGFNPNFQTGSTIGSLNVYQLTSSTAVQAQYMLGAKSSISASGSVGFLHYFGDDLLDSRNVIARVSYDRSLTARDSFNISYTASVLTYPSGVQGFYAQYIQAGYRRILTGRLHVSVSAGPVISHFSPQSGQTTVQGSQNVVDMSVTAGLEYALRNGGLNVTYNRGVTGGSGFIPGATTDQVSGSFTRRVSRVWTVTFTGGLSRNSSFEQTTPGVDTTLTFDYWSAGFAASRPIGRYSSVRFNYSAQRQTSNTTMCVNGVACGPIALTQTAGLSFNWTTRPYKLD
jgi:hypothetical protein